jgi:hypothetical protein
MKVYIVWRSNGYGNKDIVTVTLTPNKANEICEKEKRSQERYDNHYYYTAHEVEQ